MAPVQSDEDEDDDKSETQKRERSGAKGTPRVEEAGAGKGDRPRVLAWGLHDGRAFSHTGSGAVKQFSHFSSIPSRQVDPDAVIHHAQIRELWSPLPRLRGRGSG